MTEKELVRRALMGDKKAQEDCTAKGIVLPCPFCRGNQGLKIWAGRTMYIAQSAGQD